jgi:hypothetical protein
VPSNWMPAVMRKVNEYPYRSERMPPNAAEPHLHGGSREGHESREQESDGQGRGEGGGRGGKKAMGVRRGLIKGGKGDMGGGRVEEGYVSPAKLGYRYKTLPSTLPARRCVRRRAEMMWA